MSADPPEDAGGRWRALGRALVRARAHELDAAIVDELQTAFPLISKEVESLASGDGGDRAQDYIMLVGDYTSQAPRARQARRLIDRLVLLLEFGTPAASGILVLAVGGSPVAAGLLFATMTTVLASPYFPFTGHRRRLTVRIPYLVALAALGLVFSSQVGTPAFPVPMGFRDLGFRAMTPILLTYAALATLTVTVGVSGLQKLGGRLIGWLLGKKPEVEILCELMQVLLIIKKGPGATTDHIYRQELALVKLARLQGLLGSGALFRGAPDGIGEAWKTHLASWKTARTIRRCRQLVRRHRHDMRNGMCTTLTMLAARVLLGQHGDLNATPLPPQTERPLAAVRTIAGALLAAAIPYVVLQLVLWSEVLVDAPALVWLSMYIATVAPLVLTANPAAMRRLSTFRYLMGLLRGRGRSSDEPTP